MMGFGNTMIKILASHPDYEELNYLQTMLCLASNPGMFLGDMDVDDIELEEIKQILRDSISFMINPIPKEFEDFLRGLKY